MPLTEVGVKEAFEGGEAIADVHIDLVFVSELVRSQMTVSVDKCHPLAYMHIHIYIYYEFLLIIIMCLYIICLCMNTIHLYCRHYACSVNMPREEPL